MKALTLESYNNFSYNDVPDPVCGDDDVLIRVNSCGICGSDIHGMDGSSGRRIPPIIMGHEAAGTIESVGKNVHSWKSGDRVTFDSTIYCGKCDYCDIGHVNLCENRRVIGVSPGPYKQNGAFAELVVIPARILYKLPDSLSFEEAAFVEPVSIALHGVKRIPDVKSKTAVVIGAGMIGLLVIQALKFSGVSRVIAVDLDEAKLDKAKELGADEVLLSNEETVTKIHQLTNGGADVTVEVVGMSATLNLAIQSTSKGGSISLIGNIEPKTEFPLQAVVTQELTLYGSCSSNGEYEEALNLIANGKIRVRELITCIAPLSSGAEMFSKLYNSEEEMFKVILRPDNEL